MSVVAALHLKMENSRRSVKSLLIEPFHVFRAVSCLVGSEQPGVRVSARMQCAIARSCLLAKLCVVCVATTATGQNVGSWLQGWGDGSNSQLADVVTQRIGSYTEPTVALSPDAPIVAAPVVSGRHGLVYYATSDATGAWVCLGVHNAA